MSGEALARRIEGTIGRLGTRFGRGPLRGTLTRKVATGSGPNPDYAVSFYAFTCLWGTFTDAEYSDVIEDGERILLIAASSMEVEPRAGDEIAIGRQSGLRVKRVETTAPGDVAIIYRLRVVR